MTDGGPLPRVPLHPGQALAILAIAGYLLFLGASAAIAPPIQQTVGADANSTGATANATLGERATLVGLQGPFRGKQGRAVLVAGNGSVAWKSPETWAHFDVTPLENGRILAGFIRRHASNCGPYDSPCARTGFRVYDPDLEDPIVREWALPVRRHLNRESHDAEALPNGDVLVTDMDRERIVVVNPEGEITWQWRASSHYAAPANPTREDWLHINDVDRIGKGRYLVSVRNANQLVVVERGEGVVEVVNEDRSDANDGSCDKLAGKNVRCGDPSVLHHQHNPQWLGESRVLVADSGNDRVVELRERNGTWEVAWQLSSAGGIDFHWPRDVDLLENGNLLVTDSFNHRVVEVRPNGTLVWSVSPGNIPYEADRLPHGEYPPSVLDRSNASGLAGGSTGSTEIKIPGFTPLYGAASAVLPLPYWVNQWHFLGLLLSLSLTIGGLVWSRRAG